jgi:Zn-dependent protease
LRQSVSASTRSIALKVRYDPATMNLFIDNLRTDPQFFFAVCITVVVSICVHELCHGIVAIWLGDRTPIETGHMTLNPVVHMGLMSLILLLSAGIAWGAMPISPSRLRGRHARAMVAFAGPLSNVLMAVLALGALGVSQRMATEPPTEAVRQFHYFLRVFGVVNVALAIFNMLPVPPLDGSNVLADFSPEYGQLMMRLRQSGQSTIIFLLIFFFAGNYIMEAAGYIALGFLHWVRGY